MTASKISVRTSKGIRVIDCVDILYCKADGRYTRIYLKTGENYLVAKVLKIYEELLPCEWFFRIHKSYLINMAFVKEFHFNYERVLVLDDNTELIVSQRKCRMFINMILNLFPSN